VEIPRENALSILPFGPEKINRVGIISGGATRELAQALDAELDLYITGEVSHEMYHQALEGRINVIAGGHYNTEVWGVKNLSEKCAGDTGLETEFIDNPTGL
jgi:putative NIF3 family GTP cyclohydrolase 1 type 2